MLLLVALSHKIRLVETSRFFNEIRLAASEISLRNMKYAARIRDLFHFTCLLEQKIS